MMDRHQQKTTLHGNLLVIDKLGVCLVGESGIGKSELTLAMIDRGHRFISDDAIDIQKKENQLIGSAPTVNRGFLIAAGVGVVNIQQLFGRQALLPRHSIHLIVELVNPNKITTAKNLLAHVMKAKKILGITTPTIVFPVYAAKSLPLLIETVIRNYHCKQRGYDSAIEFSKRLEKKRDTHVKKENDHR